MPPPRKRLSDPATLRAMAHPVRLSIMEQLTVHGPQTATELGERLDESPANCSWHLRKLAEHGFVEEATGGLGRQRPWQVTHLGNVWGEDRDGGPVASDVQLAGQALTDVFMAREVERLHHSQTRLPSDEEPWRLAASTLQSLAWLTADELEEVNTTLREVLLRYLDRLDAPDARPPGSRLCAFVAWGVPTYGVAEPTPERS